MQNLSEDRHPRKKVFLINESGSLQARGYEGQTSDPAPPTDLTSSNGVEFEEDDESSKFIEVDSFIVDLRSEDGDEGLDDESEDDKSLNGESDEEDEVDPVIRLTEYLLGEEDEDGAIAREEYQVDPETQAKLEALFETAGIGKLTSDSQHLTDPEVLKRLTSSVSCALDEAAAALTRMRTEPPTDGRSLVEACNEGDLTKVRKLLDEGRVSVHDTTEEGESLLSLACSAGYFELAQVLLAMCANVEDRGMKGDCTPLMEAASAGHSDIVVLLIKHQADVNSQSSSGNTPLMYACAGGHEEVVRVLLESGSHVEDHNENGHTPLMEAASSGHVGVAKILLEYGAGINTHSNEFKESALTLACYKGHLEMVRFLLEAGADQEHKTDEMHTALMEASMDGHVEVARLLLDSGAQVNMPADSFESPLTLAACGGHVELAMLLLERGANIEEVNDEGYTPLMEAAREGHEEMVALLLSQGADINAQTEETQETALTLACCGGFLEVADFLIKAGADLELGASTPLMEAAQEGHLELVKYLLENGAQVNSQTGTGDTALTYACENGHTDVADLLLLFHAELEHESEGGRTPLMKAARAGHHCTVQFLISKGGDVNRATTNNDHTPLSLACAGGHLTVVELLLQYGADPYNKLKDNSTMLIEAAKGGHTAVVGLLLDYPRSIVMATPPVTNIPRQRATIETISITTAAVSGMPPVKAAGPSLKSVLRKSQRPNPAGGAKQPPIEVVEVSSPAKSAHTTGPPVNETAGYDFIEGSGFVIEGLEDGGLDAKSYIQSMLKKTQNSSREEQIIQKEQILAELQRVEKELQEKAQAQMMLSLAHLPNQMLSLNQKPNEQQNNTPAVSEKPVVTEGGILSTMRRSELHPNSSKDQIIAELHRVEKELKEKAQAQLRLSLAHIPNPILTLNSKPNEQQNTTPVGIEKPVLAEAPTANQPQVHNNELLQVNMNTVSVEQQTVPSASHPIGPTTPTTAPVPLTNSAGPTAAQPAASHGTSNNVISSLASRTANLANLPPSERPKAKPSRKICFPDGAKTATGGVVANPVGLSAVGKKIQLQAALHQHSQQLAQLQQLQQLNQQLQQQVLQQRQLKQQNQATLAALQQNAIANQQQLAALQQNVAQLQQLEQHILSQQQTPTNVTSATNNSNNTNGQQHAQLQQRVQQILQQKQQLQHQIKQFQLQVEQQLAYTQHATLPVGGGTPPPPPPTSAGPLPVDSSSTNPKTPRNKRSKDDAYSQPNYEFVHPNHAMHAVQAVSTDPNLDLCDETPFLGPSLASLDVTCQALLNGYNDGLQVGQGLAAIKYPDEGCNQILPGMIDCEQGPGSAGGHVNFSPTDLGPGGPFLQGNEQFFLPNMSGGTNPDNVITIQDHPYHVHHQHGYTDVPNKGKIPVKRYKSSTKKKELEGHDHPDIRSDLVPQGEDQVNPLASGTGLQPVTESYSSSVDLDSETESNHDTALTLACAGGHEELVKLLLERGADIEHRDKKGFTPLILAATAGHEKVVELLLDNKADIEAQSERTKDTPLSLACSGGRFEVVEILLKRNGNKEHRNVSDYTPLSLAASGGYVNIIKLLLSHGAEINSRTGSKLGISPLMLAAMNGHTSAVRLLLDCGSDINAQIETNRNTALTLACFQGRHEVVSLLLDRKANVEHRAKTGLTPLMEAASGGYVDVGRVLLDKGADVNAPPVPSSRDTALTIAADKGHYRFVELLLSRGAQVDVKNKKGNSSLWLAANGGHLEVVQLLYSAGADIDSQDNRKVSCLMSAFRKGHMKVVKWMVKHVTQFPSDKETARFIQTLTGSPENKDLLKKCQQCMDVIRFAKERQDAEAARNAHRLLEELEFEKILEESKKAAAARKREKKKKKKLERQQKDGGPVSKTDEDKDDNDFEKENRLDHVDDDEEEEETVNNHDSGIDANSQGSLEHPDKIQSGSSSSAGSSTISNSLSNKDSATNLANKKNKKNRNKKIVSSAQSQNCDIIVELRAPTQPEERKVIRPVSPAVPAVSPAPGVVIVSTSQPSAASKARINPRIQPKEKIETFEKVLSSPKKITPAYSQPLSNSRQNSASISASNSRVPSTPGVPAVVGETGWKEVVRKSKKVSVPSHAISRVIGRGGCNINAIRELSGAHIEVEKQSQKLGAGQAERSISIKGSAEATRLAHTWIQAVIANPDKEISEIVGKQQMKTLQQNQSVNTYTEQQTLVINNSNVSAASFVKPATVSPTNQPIHTGAKTVVKHTPASQPKPSTSTVQQHVGKKSSPVGAFAAVTSKTVSGASNISAFPSKPSSFAAVASGFSSNNDNFSGMMILTGTHPGSMKNKRSATSSEPRGTVNTSSSAPVPQPAMAKSAKPVATTAPRGKMEYSSFNLQTGGGQASVVEPKPAKTGSDFSPFKSFKVCWGTDIKEDSESKNFARQASSGLTLASPQDLEEPRGTSPGLPDMSKAPGYRAGPSGRIESPHGGSWNPSAEAVFPERCNSAPGTPISPVTQIVQPSSTMPLQEIGNTRNGKSHLSPGSDPDHFRPESDASGDLYRPDFFTGNLGSLGRSMTPDSTSDHKEMFRRSPGGGRPGKSSVANVNIESLEAIKAAAVQLATAAGGFSDFSSTGSGDFQYSEFSQGSRFSVPTSGTSRMLPNGGSFNQPSMPHLSKLPPPPVTSGSSGIKLNPNAPDFMRIQAPGNDYLRAPPNRIPSSSQFIAPRFSLQGPPPPPPLPPLNMHIMPNNPSTLQNILTNQGINALYNQRQAPQPLDLSEIDSNFYGRTLREITEMLAVETNSPTSPFVPSMPPLGSSGFLSGMDSPSKFSRPIGSERQNQRPQPPVVTKSPWEINPPGLFEHMSELTSNPPNFGFSSGLCGGGFEGFGMTTFNGSPEYGPGVTPVKNEFSPNYQLGSGSKKASTSYNDLSGNRPDQNSVRKNMNNLWGKAWGTDEM